MVGVMVNVLCGASLHVPLLLIDRCRNKHLYIYSNHIPSLLRTISGTTTNCHIPHLRQRDNKALVKCIKKYTDYDTKHITPDMTEADIILPTIHFSKQLSYNLEWHRGHI